MYKKLGIIGYVPPSKIRGAIPFLENARRFKTTYPLVLYSDENYQDTIKLKGSPEVVNGAKYQNGNPNPWARNNLIFLTGLSIARNHGFTEFIYLEADCRVGIDGWDAVIFNEAFSDGDPLAAGTIGMYNASNMSLVFTKAWNKFVADNVHKRFPIASFGGQGAAEKQEPAVFPNGALGVYNTEWLLTKLDLSSAPVEAARIMAWDYYVGRELVKEFGIGVFGKIKHLELEYSGYGDVATNEEERIHFLTSGQVVAIHQCKSDWPGPERAHVAPEPVLVKVEIKKRTGILIVSYLKDLEWLDYCLTSIDRFATGFDQVMVAVPREGSAPFKKLAKKHGCSLWLFDEAEGKGHLHQNALKCMADEIMPDMDFILHLDSDCVFTEPVSPEDYFVDGKPVLCYEAYENIKLKPDEGLGCKAWREPTERALGFPIEHEFMRRHPAVHPKQTYSQTKLTVEGVHNEPFLSYVLRQKGSFPYGFSEFNTLGAYAFYYAHNTYHWIDLSKEPMPKDKLIQFWSHGGLDKELEFRFNGEMIKVVPRHWMDKLLEKYKVT